MTPTPESDDLARVQAKVAAARAVLVRLLQEVVVAESRLDNSQAAQMLAANEQLVVSALRDRTDADLAAQALAQVGRSAELDPLTQLPNRVLLLDRFVQAIAAAKRSGNRVALLFLDLDNFKENNDRLGHGVGDEVLKRVARRLVGAVRDADTVSRHGGDEFLILLGGVADASDAAVAARKLVAALAAPTRVGDHVLRLAASIGISLYPDDGTDVALLIERADAAMYRAKREGLATFAFHGAAAAPETLPPPLAALHNPLAHHPQVLADHETRHGELRDANERLLLAALDAQQLKGAAEQAQRRQAEFLAVVAQELANPLAPIRVATAMLGRARTDEALLPLARSIIERQTATMARLVAAIGEVSRANTAALELERLPLDMAVVVDMAVAASRPALDRRLQSFVLELPPQPISVRGDAERLAQVISNLLDNASKYTPDQGAIRLTLEVQGGQAVVTVSDNGIGITPAALANLFNPFVQDIHAIGFNGVGVGIGLTVVRALVEAHGGKVSARSAGAGLGSQFIVTLPLADAEAPP